MAVKFKSTRVALAQSVREYVHSEIWLLGRTFILSADLCVTPTPPFSISVLRLQLVPNDNDSRFPRRPWPGYFVNRVIPVATQQEFRWPLAGPSRRTVCEMFILFDSLFS